MSAGEREPQQWAMDAVKEIQKAILDAVMERGVEYAYFFKDEYFSDTKLAEIILRHCLAGSASSSSQRKNFKSAASAVSLFSSTEIAGITRLEQTL